ncbi:MAG: hypothetical protein FE043_00590 [Thermoplasmata archaeon]|nr:MAG: hypothetical protein FE043_00590 [Thermoplasmata archaeon]
MKVVAFTGLPGSGKTEAVGVAEEAGFDIVRMGDEVRAEVKRRGMPLNDRNLGAVANEMREKEGMDIWARRCLAKLKELEKEMAGANAKEMEMEDAKGMEGAEEGTGEAGKAIHGAMQENAMHENNEKIVIIDGIRNIDEVETFKKNVADFILVAVHASPKTRYGRMMKRGRQDDSLSVDDLRKRDERELAWGIGNAVAMADIIITNEGTLEQFREKVRGILDEISR